MHIVVLPFPVQGHLNPCLLLARLLASQGFTFTFVVTEELATKLKEEGSSSIQHATIPYIHEGASQPPSKTAFDFPTLLEMVDGLRPGFHALLRKLTASPPGVSCILFDCFVRWGQQVASEFNIPVFAFYTTNAHAFTIALHARALISNGLPDSDKIIDDIPGLLPLRIGDLPQSMRILPSFAASLTKDLHKTAGVILNTVFELEKEPLEVIRSKVPFYTIGPMLLMLGSEKSLVGGQNVGLWAEERGCLAWLNTKPDDSVLFVAFGSLANIECDQIKELAMGLEASGQAFLWVIRSTEPLSNLLPEGFVERTIETGLIISWAPQLEVLSHPAVGGFITHCGWNSLTENLSLRAVPMICWPQLAEQRLNQRLLVDKWKVGLELQEEDGFVKKAKVEKAVREVMQGEVGRELRKTALELKETILTAVQEGGSSQCYLKALGEDIRRIASGLHANKAYQHFE